MRRILLPALMVVHLLAAGAVLQPGDAWPPIALKDQHEKPLAIARDVKLIFFAAEMDSTD